MSEAQRLGAAPRQREIGAAAGPGDDLAYAIVVGEALKVMVMA